VSKPIVFLSEAEDELRAAAEWYDDRAELGDELAAEVLAATMTIVEFPLAFALAQGVAEELGVRSAPVKRFPYRVVFVELDAEIRIVAIAHARRRPGYWRTRVEGG
jgi:plasmid stabilization system protein ParE